MENFQKNFRQKQFSLSDFFCMVVHQPSVVLNYRMKDSVERVKSPKEFQPHQRHSASPHKAPKIIRQSSVTNFSRLRKSPSKKKRGVLLNLMIEESFLVETRNDSVYYKQIPAPGSARAPARLCAAPFPDRL